VPKRHSLDFQAAMVHTIILPPMSSPEPEVTPNLNIVIAYEDFESGKEAKTTCDFLTDNLGPEWQFGNQMWKFDVLNIPELRNMAAKDAAMADIIIVSSRGGNDLPDSVKAWMELWLGAQSNPIALVALFSERSHQEDKIGTIRAYLADVAQRGQMEFFAQPVNLQVRQMETAPLSVDAATDRAERTLAVLTGATQHDKSFPRWGINE